MQIETRALCNIYSGEEEELYLTATQMGDLIPITRELYIGWHGIQRKYIEFCHFRIMNGNTYAGDLKQGNDGWCLIVNDENAGELTSERINRERIKREVVTVG